MAKSAKRKTSAKRTSKSSARRKTSRRSSSDINPAGWLASLMNSQTGRVIAAEALVAAAGAAAAVLVATKTQRGQSLMKAGRDTTEMLRDAARDAAIAAGEVIGNMSADAIGNLAKDKLGGPAGEMVGAVARSVMARNGFARHEETQFDIAERAMEMKRTGRNPRSRPRNTRPQAH